MQKIEINTTQNVSIEFEVASIRERILAFLLDILIMGGSAILLSLLLLAIFRENSKYLIYLLVTPIVYFYTIAFEVFNNGQSIGKKVLDIKVVKLNGNEPRTSDYVLRWAFRLIDIYSSAGILAVIFIGSSNKNQRIGDMAAETTVIKIKPSRILSLNDIDSIDSIERYEITYPQTKKFAESDMLLIKSVLDRYRSYPNQAHREALKMMVARVKEEIEIDQNSLSDTEFLQVLIKDYVVMTR